MRKVKPTSVRLDVADLKKLDKLGIRLSSLVKEAVATAIGESKCATCGQKIKEKKK